VRHLDVRPFSGDRQSPLGDAEGGGIGSGEAADLRLVGSNSNTRLWRARKPDVRFQFSPLIS